MAQIGYKADRKRILYDSSYLIDLYMKKGFSRDQAIRIAEEESANTNAFKNPISPLRESSEWITDVANILRDQKNTEDYKKLLKEDYSITYEQLENLDPVRSYYKGTDIEINKLENIILKVMKFKKGSKAAKDFMAKLRAARKGAKKKTIGSSRNTGMNKNTFNKLEELEKKKKRKSDAKKLRKAKKISGEKHNDNKSHNYKINISGMKENQTYDIHFNDEYNSDNKGFKESLAFCKKYIRMYNGTKQSYFADYKNGIVEIVNNNTGNAVYSTKIK